MKFAGKIFFPVIFVISAFCSCDTLERLRTNEERGMMYAMIYDYENMPVSGVKVFIGEKEIAQSDTQGRFILVLEESVVYAAVLVKNGYEKLEREIEFRPMDVLYFKMINAQQFLRLAEEALDEHRYKDAELLLERAAALDTRRGDVLFLQCITYFLQGEYGRARDGAENLIRMGYTKDYVHRFLEQLSGAEKALLK
jgi:hypothetical protein